MEEAAENGNEWSHRAHADGMNVLVTIKENRFKNLYVTHKDNPVKVVCRKQHIAVKI
jgi:hypothetical protein